MLSWVELYLHILAIQVTAVLHVHVSGVNFCVLVIHVTTLISGGELCFLIIQIAAIDAILDRAVFTFSCRPGECSVTCIYM